MDFFGIPKFFRTEAYSAVVYVTTSPDICKSLKRDLMEFICVLSVSGSLASYQVRKEGENNYSATLRTNNGKRDDVPTKFYLRKNNGEWLAEPWHEEIVPGITHAIDMAP